MLFTNRATFKVTTSNTDPVRASAVQPRQMPPATDIDGATADPGRAMTGGPPSHGLRRAPGRDLSACVAGQQARAGRARAGRARA